MSDVSPGAHLFVTTICVIIAAECRHVGAQSPAAGHQLQTAARLEGEWVCSDTKAFIGEWQGAAVCLLRIQKLPDDREPYFAPDDKAFRYMYSEETDFDVRLWLSDFRREWIAPDSRPGWIGPDGKIRLGPSGSCLTFAPEVTKSDSLILRHEDTTLTFCRRRSSAAVRTTVGCLSGTAGRAVPLPNGSKQITNSIGMKLTLIPAGEFLMGSRESAEHTAAFFQKSYGPDYLMPERFADEHPRHRVRITQAFYLGTYHVTRGQFRRFVNDTGYRTEVEKGIAGALKWNSEHETFLYTRKYSWHDAGFEQTDEHPVVIVNFNDAVAFCEWLSRKEGKTYRLPTEAEWEYACSAGTDSRYYSGDDPESLAQVGNVADATAKARLPARMLLGSIKASDGYVFTSPVGSFRPNAFGLYDMHGNVCQWCADWYSQEYYATSPGDDPKGPGNGEIRVLRGGSWFDAPYGVCSAFRLRQKAPMLSDDSTGFRVACSVFEPPEKRSTRESDAQEQRGQERPK